VWHLKGIKRNTDEGRCLVCLVEDDIKSKKWLSMNTEVACRKIVRCPNKGQIRNLGRYVDKVKYKWFYKTK
jgi:hypothetical protein